MTHRVLEPEVIRDAVLRACRAPSLHNSQPWHWVAESGRLHLFLDHESLVLATDRSGREMILNCGAVLDHLRVAMAAAGWDTTIHRFPDPNEANHLAMLVLVRERRSLMQSGSGPGRSCDAVLTGYRSLRPPVGSRWNGSCVAGFTTMR